MKSFYILAMGLAGVILATSCSNEANNDNEPVVQQPVQLVFQGMQSDGSADTRSYLNGGQVYWHENDRINVFSRGVSYPFVTKEEGQYAYFVGVVLDEDIHYYGLFPYDESATYNSATYTYTTTFPAEQTAVANSFAKDANVTVAHTNNDDMTFHFKNVCGLIKFTITSAETSLPFTKAVLSGLSSENIAGAMSIVYDYTAAVSLTNPGVAVTGGNSITLYAPSGTTFEKDTDYYFVVPPTEFTNGYKITFSNDDDSITKEHTVAASEVQRSKILDAGSYTYVPTP